MMRPKYTIKQILASNENWWNFHEAHQGRLRPAIVECITNLLSCKDIVRGYREYHCSNPACTHIKRVAFTCKSRACSSCGKKATEAWTQKQNDVLPNTSWQHITFTMPSELWDFFWYNRWLLGHIAKIAANCIKKLARDKKAVPGIFIAIHTFGRDLKRNVHVHVSTTTGGLSFDGTRWKKLFFHQATLMRMWRNNIVKLFRKAHQKKALIVPSHIQRQLSHVFTFGHFLDGLYNKYWIVHCAKPTNGHKHNVNYLGRYIKRPAIAESKLKHYDGHEVRFKYLDHATKTYRNFLLSAEQFIARFIQHIPDKHFRLIRYYGFLAHRARGKLLPIVYRLLGQETKDIAPPPTYAQMMLANFNVDPLRCILCDRPMLLVHVEFGKNSTRKLLPYHRQLAQLKKI